MILSETSSKLILSWEGLGSGAVFNTVKLSVVADRASDGSAVVNFTSTLRNFLRSFYRSIMINLNISNVIKDWCNCLVDYKRFGRPMCENECRSINI